MADGLQFDKITPSYIRRHCLFDSKQLNLNTIKKYVNEFLKLDQYQPPKPKKAKPTNKKARAILELQERMEEIEDRTEHISYERDVLESEKNDLYNRLDEIKEENEELEAEHDTLTEELEEAQASLDELTADPEVDEEQVVQEEVEQDAPGESWPEPEELEVQAKKDGKKWHVWAEANGRVFEKWLAGTKIKAIKQLRIFYTNAIIGQ